MRAERQLSPSAPVRPIELSIAVIEACCEWIDEPDASERSVPISAEIRQRTTIVGSDLAQIVEWLRRLERLVVDRLLQSPELLDMDTTRRAIGRVGDIFSELSDTSLQAHSGTKEELKQWYERVATDLLTCLVAGAPVDRSLLNSQARILSIEPRQPFRAVTMHHDEKLSAAQWQKVLRRLKVALRRYDPSQEKLMRDSQGLFLAIIPADRPADLVQILNDFLQTDEHPLHLYVSTGEPAETLAGAGRSCQQALSALEIATYRGQRGKVTECTEVILEVLLTHNHWVSERIAKSRLQQLIDRPNLLVTLRAYINCDMTLQRTAEELFVHPNTVAYRLRQIGQLTGREMRSVSDLADLTVALAAIDILDMQRNHENGSASFQARFLGD